MSTHSTTSDLLDQSRPIREVWTQAWPTVLTMTSYTVMQFIDSLMVARIGHMEVAAQGNGGVWSFAVICFGFGLLTVVNTFVAQHLGAGEKSSTARYGWSSIWISLLMWLVVLLPAAAVFHVLFEAIGHEAELIELEVQYGRILLVGGCFLLASKGMSNWFFGYQRPQVITFAAILGNVVNVIANYILIFGEGGLPLLGLPGIPGTPALGVLGAGIGTVLGTMVELLVPLCIFLGPRINAEIRSRAAWRPDFEAIRNIFRVGWPAGLQIGNEIVCWAIFMTLLVGHFGADDMSAGWIVNRYLHFSFMPAVGFSVATTSLVGKWVGAGHPDIAVSRARIALMLAVGYMTFCGIMFVIFRGPMVGIFIGESVSPDTAAEILRIGSMLMICGAFFQTMDAVGIVYTGALRGVGDTVWPGIATVCMSWIFLIGSGVLVIHLWPGLESLGPWLGALAYIILLGFVMGARFERGRWRSIDLLGRGRSQEPADE